MIDPVRTGSVGGTAAIGNSVRRSAPGLSPAAPRETAIAGSSRTATPLPQLFNLLADLADAPPPVDYPKVAQVRRAIADGDYSVDAGALARAILRFDANT